MKRLFTISLITIFALLANNVLASTNDNPTKNKSEASDAKENLELGEEKTEEINTDPAVDLTESQESDNNQPIQDTTNINSVCKFNFIFYFIYKVKYDENATASGYLEYNF